MSVVISSSLVLDTSYISRTNAAQILYKSYTGTVTASANNTDAINLTTETTYDRWKPGVTASDWKIEFPENYDINCVGIGAHNLGTTRTAIAIQYFDGAAWVTIQDMLPADDSAIMMIFDTLSYFKIYRLLLNGPGVDAEIGVLKIGKTLQMQRGIYGGHSPILLSANTEIRNNFSERGNFLGKYITRSGYSTSFAWSNLTSEWYREHFQPFVKYIKTGACFIAWRPTEYPQEVAYGWVNEDITPSNSGTRNFMDVSFSFLGHNYEFN